MANSQTATQRYNNRMDKIYANAIQNLQKNCKHTYYLKCESFSMQKYYRECGKCGKKAKCTKYKISI